MLNLLSTKIDSQTSSWEIFGALLTLSLKKVLFKVSMTSTLLHSVNKFSSYLFWPICIIWHIWSCPPSWNTILFGFFCWFLLTFFICVRVFWCSVLRPLIFHRLTLQGMLSSPIAFKFFHRLTTPKFTCLTWTSFLSSKLIPYCLMSAFGFLVGI